MDFAADGLHPLPLAAIDNVLAAIGLHPLPLAAILTMFLQQLSSTPLL